ncbi:MAG: hypothetical protein ACRBDX_03515 [Gammaproteobacteria bacterium]
MNIERSICNILLPILLIFMTTMMSSQAKSGGVKIIIGGADHNRSYHYSKYDNSYHLYDKYNYENRDGVRDRYGKKFKNIYYGNESYGYGDNYGYSDRGRYRNSRGYCPY